MHDTLQNLHDEICCNSRTEKPCARWQSELHRNDEAAEWLHTESPYHVTHLIMFQTVLHDQVSSHLAMKKPFEYCMPSINWPVAVHT